jgi:hypothetical protein
MWWFPVVYCSYMSGFKFSTSMLQKTIIDSKQDINHKIKQTFRTVMSFYYAGFLCDFVIYKVFAQDCMRLSHEEIKEDIKANLPLNVERELAMGELHPPPPSASILSLQAMD